ncbi:MAG: hypothetical protein RR620_10420 [Clostridium sp.]
MDKKIINKDVKKEKEMKSFSVIVKNGRRKVMIINTFTGEDNRQAAADVVLGNNK